MAEKRAGGGLGEEVGDAEGGGVEEGDVAGALNGGRGEGTAGEGEIAALGDGESGLDGVVAAGFEEVAGAGDADGFGVDGEIAGSRERCNFPMPPAWRSRGRGTRRSGGCPAGGGCV